MRNFKAIFSVVLALAVHGVHAVTGPAAAELITSDAGTVGYQTPESYLLQFQRIQGGTVDDYEYSVESFDDVEAVFNTLSGIISAKEAMLNAMKALANVAILHETDTWLGKRIEALEKSAKNALAQVDKTEVIDEHGNQIESILKIIKKPGDEGETIEVTTEGTPVDKKSIDYTGMPTGPNKPAPLEIKGFSDAVGLNWLIPHPKGSALAWDGLQELIDLETIDSTSDSARAFGIKLGLKGWNKPLEVPGLCTHSLTEMLGGKDDATPHYVLTKHGDALHYTPIGDAISGGPAVDNASLTTNEVNGAAEQGKASLYGWNLPSARGGAIPCKGNGNPATLDWKAPGDMVDGTSIATTERGEGVVWEVRDAHSYAGAQARHYFGTGDDSALGWHELPNVTTNNVVGDEKTISSTFDQTGETKIFGLKGFPTSGTLLALACQGGDLLYIPFPAGGGTNIVAVDDMSVSSNTTGRLQLNGWETQGSCSEKAAEILAGGEATAQSKHEIVTRYGGAGGSIHYLPFDVFPHPNTDDFTIDPGTKAFTIKGEEGKFLCGTAQGGVEWKPTNGVDGASIILAENVAALNGFAGADPGMMPFKDDGGKLAWREQAPVAVDRVSVVTNQDREITLNGFSVASDNAVPFKSNGVLVWGSVAAITNRIVAGAGINVTDNGEGTLTISAKALDTNGGTATYQTLTVVTSVQYNPSTHKFQCKTRQITFLGSAQAESGWTDVFEATSHKGEHQ